MTATVFGELGFLGMLTLVGALQGLVLALYIAAAHRDNTAMRWLVVLIALMSLHLFDMTLSKTQLVRYFVWVSDSTFAFIFLIGPLYYAYVRALLQRQVRFRAVELLHALPTLYILAEMLPWLTAPADYRLTIKLQMIGMAEGPPLPLSVYLKLGFNIVQNLAYLFFSTKLIKQASARFTAVSADTDIAESMKSLLLLTRRFAVWVALYLLTFVALAIWGTYGSDIDHFWLFINALFIQVLGFGALVRPPLFGDAIDTATPPSADMDRKYEKSSLGDDDSKALKTAFERLMKEEKPYLDGTLRMPDIAHLLGVTPHHLSQMLNQDMGASFLAIVNRYRIKEVQQLLQERRGARDTVLALAFEAGFNNKNTFNRCFREETGQTPSAFRKAVAQNV